MKFQPHYPRGHPLFEQDRTEARVKGAETFISSNLSETTDETGCERRLGHEADSRRLQRAECNISEELSRGGRGKVDGRSIVRCSFVSEIGDELLLEELVTAEFEGALKEVARRRRTEARQQSPGSLIRDDLSECADHTPVVSDRVELNPRLDTAHPLASA